MAVLVPIPKRWTVEECDTLERFGVLPQRYELLEGEIYEKMSPNPIHSITLHLLLVAVETIFGREYVRSQDPILLGKSSRPEPDLAVLRETVPSYWEQHPTPNDILLLAEVSHATLQFDLTTKALLYAKAGISEYWVLDVEERHVVVHREPTPEGYRNITFHGEEEAISPLARPESPLSVSKLFVATKRNT